MTEEEEKGDEEEEDDDDDDDDDGLKWGRVEVEDELERVLCWSLSFWREDDGEVEDDDEVKL